MIQDNYTDIHSHVLFGVDDGARGIDESMQMLKTARDEGIRTVFATPHNGIENGYEPSASLIRENFRALQQRAALELPDMLLYLGSELYCAPDQVLKRVEQGLALPMAGTKYMLLEFLEWGDHQETAEHITQAMLAIAKTGWLPILAHAHRYKDFCGKQHLYRDMADGGVYLQINAYDLADRPDDWTRENARWLAAQGLARFIGTDAHRMDHRQPVMRSGVSWLYDHCDEAYVDALVHNNAARLIRGERITPA